MDIFEENKLYPLYDEKLTKHYNQFSDIFISLIPFIQIDRELEEYPDDGLILKEGHPYSWEKVIQNSALQNSKELNKALMTSIGAYKKEFRRNDLLKSLTIFSKNNNIWDPTEGTFDVFSKQSIYRVLKELNKTDLDVVEEFYESKKKIDLKTFSEIDFVNEIDLKDYYIYPTDQTILFAIDWDYYFFFIAIKSDQIDKKLIENNFEGFWASKKDSHNWCWEEGEIESILGDHTKKYKNWWQKFFMKKRW